MAGPIRDLAPMLAGMNPSPDPEVYVFCCLDPGTDLAGLAPLGSFREAEGLTLILTRAGAAARGLAAGPPMRRIVLEVHSALEGVGLTAAVATALAGEGIACNMVAAFHHDHVFVPAADASRALETLRALQARSG